jgi:hypothetical protein
VVPDEGLDELLEQIVRGPESVPEGMFVIFRLHRPPSAHEGYLPTVYMTFPFVQLCVDNDLYPEIVGRSGMANSEVIYADFDDAIRKKLEHRSAA